MNANQLIGFKELCVAVDVKPHIIEYLYRSFKMPEPKKLIGRRIYTPKDVEEIKQALSKNLSGEKSSESQPNPA